MFRIQKASERMRRCRRDDSAVNVDTLTGFGKFGASADQAEAVPRVDPRRSVQNTQPCFGARRGYKPVGQFGLANLPRQ
jgi:hypothetical protein